MRKPTERTERWIEVEALCQCARLERAFGASMIEHLDQLDEDERLVAQMRRLCKGRRRLAHFRAVVQSSWRRLKSLMTASHRLVAETPTRQCMGRYGVRSSFGGEPSNGGHHSERIAA